MVRTHFSQRQQFGKAPAYPQPAEGRGPLADGRRLLHAGGVGAVVHDLERLGREERVQQGAGAPADEVADRVARGHVQASHSPAESERASQQGAAMEESPFPAGQEGLHVGARGYEVDTEARHGLDDAGAGAVIGGHDC